MGSGMQCEVWSPFKNFFRLMEAVIYEAQTGKLHDLKTACANLHLRFLAPLKNPPRDATSKMELEKAKTQGLRVPGSTKPLMLHETLADEACVMANVFDMNEMVALDLILIAESEQINFPGMARGLVAVLLYYDGRKDLLHGLATLFHSATGRTWAITCDADPETCEVITNIRDELLEDGIVGHFLDALSMFSVNEEWERLGRNGGLGNARHRRMVMDMLRDLRRTAAKVIHHASAQAGLKSSDAVKLLRHLRRTSLASSPNGVLDDADVALFFAACHVLVPHDPAVDSAQDGDVSTDGVRNLIIAVHGELSHVSGTDWQCPGMKAALQLAWGLSLRQLSQNKSVMKDDVIRTVTEEDEAVVDAALSGHPFAFLKTPLLENPHVALDEFYLRALHGFITDFIILMPMKAKELRNAAANTNAIDVLSAGSAVRNFTDLLWFMQALYASDPLGLCLSAEFWVSPEVIPDESPRQLSLHQFVISNATIQNTMVLVPFLEMLAALSSNPKSAPLCFDLLRSGKFVSGCGAGETLLTWDHFIRSIDRYCASMRHEQAGADGGHSMKVSSIHISDAEVRGLKAVLLLIECIGKNDPVARMEFLGRGLWNLPLLLLGLVTCPVHLQLKAAALRTLTALVPYPTGEHDMQTSVSLNRSLWVDLENSQILRTVEPRFGTPMSQYGDLKTELEQVENRLEEFIVTRAFIGLLEALSEVGGVPSDLGCADRPPGLEPYLSFILEDIFMRFTKRSYKDRKECWEIAGSCLDWFAFLVQNYPTVADDFAADAGSYVRIELKRMHLARGAGPGYLVMRRVLIGDGDIIRLAMYVAEECVLSLEDEDSSVSDPLWKAGLAALKFIGACLEAQVPWESLYRESMQKGQVVFPPETRVDKVLVGSNERSGRPGYLVTIAKFLPACRWAAEHAREAIGILHRLIQSKPAQSQMLSLFTSPSMKGDILEGFVECLDEDQNELETNEDKLGAQNRQRVLRFILRCLSSSSSPQPNVAHFLLGFNVNEPLYDSSLQNPGVMDTQRSCLHALMNILDSGTDTPMAQTEEGEALNQPLNSLMMPATTVLCYQVLYKLCSNEDTGPATLRHLRNSREFLLRHLQMLPFYGDDEAHLWEQMGYLLRTVAVDMTTSATKGHRLRLARFVSALLDPSFDAEAAGEVKLPITVGGGVGHPERARLSALLQAGGSFCLDAELVASLHDVELMEPKAAMKLMEAAKVPVGPGGPSLYSLPRLRQLLDDELSASGLLPASPDYHAFQSDVDRVLEFAARKNNFIEYQRAMTTLFDGWRRVAETLFYLDPVTFLEESEKQKILVHLMESLLDKCDVEEYPLSDLIRLAAGVLLVMSNCLTHSFAVERDLVDERSTMTVGVEKHADAIVGIVKKAVRVLTKNAESDRTKIYLYCVISKLVMAVEEAATALRIPVVKGMGGALPHSQYSPRKSILHVFDTFKTSFYKIVAEDCLSGHDALKMVALSCISVICSLSRADGLQPTLSLASTAPDVVLARNVFQRVLSSLMYCDRGLADELALSGSLTGFDSTRVCQMFRSKLYLLTAAASAGDPRKTGDLIEGGLINTLTQITSLHHHSIPPEMVFRRTAYEERQRSIFLPALRIVAMAFRRAFGGGKQFSFGSDMGPVLGFLAAFHDNVLAVLKMNHPIYKRSDMTETSALVDVFSLIGSIDPTTLIDAPVLDPSSGVILASVELQTRYMTYRKLFVGLVAKYLLSDRAFVEIDEANETLAEKQVARLAFIGIIANIVQFACEAVYVNQKKKSVDRETLPVCLFSPSLIEGTAREVRRMNETQTSSSATDEFAASLGVVVYQLKKATALFLSLTETEKRLAVQLSASPGSTPPVSTTPTNRTADLSRNSVAVNAELLNAIRKEKKVLTTVIEGCSLLISYHLQYYLVEIDSPSVSFSVRAAAKQAPGVLKSAVKVPQPPPGPSVRREDIVQLRADMSLALSDSLFSSMKEVSRVLSSQRKNMLFFDSQLKRLQKLASVYAS